MPRLLLTDRRVKALKPQATRIDYHDAQLPGLALRVTPTGEKSWSVRYRHRGRLRRLTLGRLDAISLATARERARDGLQAASKGFDPAAAKQAGRKTETIGDLAELYLEKHAKVRN